MIMSHSFFSELWFLTKALFSSKPLDKETSECIYMKHFPFSGYKAMQWCGYIIFNKEENVEKATAEDINHETIHLRQAQDKGSWFVFYLSYLWNWIKHDPIFHSKTAYYLNKYEVEAYAKEDDMTYLSRREKNNVKKFSRFKMESRSLFSYYFKQKVKEEFKEL